MNWQLQEAKNKLSQVVKEARRSGPQIITVRGEDAAVDLSMDEYRRLTQKKDNLADFFMNSPLRNSGVEIERDQDFGRDIEL